MVSVLILSADAGAADRIETILRDAPDIVVAAQTQRLTELAELCAHHFPAVLIVCTAGDLVDARLIAEVSSRECTSVAGILMIDIRETQALGQPDPLIAMVRRIGAIERPVEIPVAYRL